MFAGNTASATGLVEMMQERGVEVNSSTIMRWVHRCAPELEKRVPRYQGVIEPPPGALTRLM